MTNVHPGQPAGHPNSPSVHFHRPRAAPLSPGLTCGPDISSRSSKYVVAGTDIRFCIARILIRMPLRSTAVIRSCGMHSRRMKLFFVNGTCVLGSSKKEIGAVVETYPLEAAA